MFDGLKEKLGSFTSDVEEDVDEEAIEEADAETGTSPEADTGRSETVEHSEAAETREMESSSGGLFSFGSSGTDGETDDHDATELGQADPTGGSAASPVEAEQTDEEVEQSESGDPEGEADASGSGRGLAGKAKIFATGKTVIDEDDLRDHLDDLELALLSSDVEMGVAQEILDGVEENLTGQTRRRLSSTGNLVRDALREALYDVISVGQFDFEQRVAEAEKPVVIIFTGVNGVGKTTSIAKLSQYLEDRGDSSVLANGDTYRAGANEQLEQHARNRDVRCISHEQGSDPTAVIYDAVEYAEANDVDVVLGDTAGRLHTSDDLMAQLEKIDRVIDPDMTLFVDEAVAGQDAVNRAREFDEAAEIDGAVLTKADADPQGGAAISIAHVTGEPILFLGTGQDYDDLRRFDPEEIVDQLLGP